MYFKLIFIFHGAGEGPALFLHMWLSRYSNTKDTLNVLGTHVKHWLTADTWNRF